MEKFQVGNTVEFSARGKTIRGTVTDIKASRPGSRHALVRAYGLPTPSVTKYVVMPNDGGGVWTVPESMLKKIGQDKNVGQTVAKSRELITQISQSHIERSIQGRNAADAAGVYDLKRGEKIEIKTRGGSWMPAIFSHVSQNGRVGFTLGDNDPSDLHNQFNYLTRTKEKIHFSPPQFVRRAMDKVS
jgi:hypothetical protein